MSINNKHLRCGNCNKLFLKSHLKAHEQICRKNTRPNIQNPKQIPKQQQPQPQPQNQLQVYKPKQQVNNSQLMPYYNDSLLNHYFNQYDKMFVKYIENKSVALVGPAQSILNTNNGHIIDKFDMIVRLNKSLPLPDHLKNDIGTRTDIIYNSLNRTDYPGQNNLDTNLYKNHGVSFVCSSYPFNHNVFHDDIANYVYRYKFDIPLKVMNDGKFRNFENSLATRPYTGTCAIMDLLSYPIKHLYITGLDFYETKYISVEYCI